MNIKELGYIVLAASDISAWRLHAQNILGAMVSDSLDGGIRLRLDERDCRILVKPAEKDKLLGIGWLLTDQDAYDQALKKADAQDLCPREGSSQECAERRVTSFFAVKDPAGLTHEMAWGPVVNFRDRFISPAGASFVTGDQGLGHLVVGCERSQYQATCEFLRRSLGFKVSNFRSQSLDETPVEIPITWFHCENTRQHTLGLAATSAPGSEQHGCRHINLEVADLDDVGRAYDRCERQGARIARSLGRHVNDLAISFYLESPSRFLFEYGWGAPRRDWTQEIAYDEGGAGSIWGHKRLTGQ
ncbi:MAG: VOC family protein [Pseudomonadota bacterium]